MSAPEVRAQAVRMVVEQRGEHAWEWAAVSSIASKIGAAADTLLGWVRPAERAPGVCVGPTSEEREDIKALERDVRELRQANEILRKGLGGLVRWRNSTAGRSCYRVRRRSPRRPWGRADLPAAGDRTVDLVRACRPAV